MHCIKTLPAAIAAALAAVVLVGIGACSKGGAESGEQAASSAEASASSAEASSALAQAARPAAGTADVGENAKTNKPAVSISEEAQAGGDEASQGQRNRVAAAKAAGNAPTQADVQAARKASGE